MHPGPFSHTIHWPAQDAPDVPVTTIAIECDSEPKQDNIYQ